MAARGEIPPVRFVAGHQAGGVDAAVGLGLEQDGPSSPFAALAGSVFAVSRKKGGTPGN